VRIRGRLASLLEVGTGFHPELTGRENIFLNGAILGMRRSEIRKKFDEMVAFAEVERFLDTPVKRYSSGMYVRLAFSVAAHLEPDILVVDEVLAVGDAKFQKKCLGKMHEVSAQQGRTVLFVSHQMATVVRLCHRGLLLDGGALVWDGKSDAAVERYLKSLEDKQVEQGLASRTDREGTGAIRFEDVWLTDSGVRRRGHVCSGESVQIHIAYSNHTGRDLRDVLFAVAVDSPLLGRVFVCQTNLVGAHLVARASGGELVLTIPRVPLTAGVYTANLFSAQGSVQGEILDFVRQALCLEVEEGDYFGTGQVPTGGVSLVAHSWCHS
jgi:lipopolysaccharide transport system ATP-binding protein